MDEGVKRLIQRSVEASSADEAKQFASAAMDCAYAIKCSNGRVDVPDVFPESVEVPVVVNPEAEEPEVIGVLTLPREYAGFLAGSAADGNPLGLMCRVAKTKQGYDLLQMTFVGLPAEKKS